MKPSLLIVFLSVVLFVPMAGGLFAEESPSAFQQFANLAQTAADKQGAKILIKYDAEKKLLQVARELQVNQFRKMTQVQSVELDKLQDEADLVTVGTMTEPWLRINCKDKKKNVQFDSTQTINGAQDENLTKEDRLAFLTLPCHPSELKKLQAAYAEFKKSVSR